MPASERLGLARDRGQLAVAAAGPALRDSGIAADDPRCRDIGVIVGTGLGGIRSNDAQFKTMYTRGPRLVSPLAIPMIMYNAAASHISMRFGLRGPNLTVTTACSSSSNAIGEAFRSIKHGYTEIMVAGGADAPITPGILAAWCALRALSIRIHCWLPTFAERTFTNLARSIGIETE